MSSERPSDAAIAAAFWEIRPSVVCDAVPFRRSVIERATELDATAAPVPDVEAMRSLADVFAERSDYWSRHKGEYAQGRTNAYCEAEADLRAALATAHTAAPVVVWEDMVESALRAFHGDGGNFWHVQWTEDQKRSMRAALTAALAGD